MIQLDNQTSWSAGLYPGWNRQGQRQQTLVVKIGFAFDNRGQLTPHALPIVASDEYRSEPETSSLTAATETVPFKRGAEFYLYGSAQPGPSTSESVQVAVGLRYNNSCYWSKDIRVFGKRRWERNFFTLLPGSPEPLVEPLELIYEHAYGGHDPHHQHEGYLANPAGCGFSLRGLRSKGLTLPQLEQGPPFIASPASRVRPAGFGPIPSHWAPRSEVPVTIDSDAVAAGTCPFKGEQPQELYNCAPRDQRFEQPFVGPMTLKLTGLVANSPRELLLKIPEPTPVVQVDLDLQEQIMKLSCDTLIVDSQRQTLALVFRGAVITCPDPDPNGWITLKDGNPVAQSEGTAEYKRTEQEE